MAHREYTRTTDDDPDVAEMRLFTSVLNDDRIDTLDPLALLELCEEYEVSITYIIHISRKQS